MNIEIDNFLKTNLSRKISNNTPMEEILLEVCESFYSTPVHNLQDMKLRTTKIKGDIFEHFSRLYLLHVYGLKEVWFLADIPESILLSLKLKRQDLGIDLVGRDDVGNFYAIQAKYRKRSRDKKIVMSWKSLSTFYGLCSRTGPYHKFIVITTADYIRRVGHKTQNDVSINWGKIKKISHFQWMTLSTTADHSHLSSTKQLPTTPSTSPGQIQITPPPPHLTRDQLRKKRLIYYQQKENTQQDPEIESI